ncbi:MAG TPA: glutathione S-transferase [Kofleriaceae bacterium]|nr:glutathione S-transferase [Kofleriaceae bacterium]
MITVHHLNNSRSQRVLWLLEELGQPYEIVKYERDPRTLLAPASLRAIHPLGKSPVITDGDATIAESGAILEYLVETYGKDTFAPAPGSSAHRLYRYFLHYAEGSLMPLLLMKLVFNKVKTDAPWLVRPVARTIARTVSSRFLDPNLSTHLAFLADHLGKHTWFAGDMFTAADVQMSFPVEGAVARAGGAISPRLTEWLARIQARPAYRRAIERGGAYQVAG